MRGRNLPDRVRCPISARAGSATGRSWLTASAKRWPSVPSSKARAADATPAASVPVTTHVGRSSGRFGGGHEAGAGDRACARSCPSRVEHARSVRPSGAIARVDAAGARPVLERVGRRIEAQRGPGADEHAQRLRRARGLQPAARGGDLVAAPAGRRPAGRRRRGRRRTRCARAGACRRCRAGRARGTSRRRPACARSAARDVGPHAVAAVDRACRRSAATPLTPARAAGLAAQQRADRRRRP